MARIEKGPQHIDIAALLCLVPKAGIEPARAWPTAPSTQRVYQFHHLGNLGIKFSCIAPLRYSLALPP